jgi:hypothetical protein
MIILMPVGVAGNIGGAIDMLLRNFAQIKIKLWLD